MTSGAVLLTGAGGFVGGHVLQGLRALPAAPRLRLLQHRRPLAVDDGGHEQVVTADLAEPATLAGICKGITVLIHAASYLGNSAERCVAVNAEGTEALVAVARQAGVPRIIYVSNAAVYGYATHRRASEADVVLAPATAISRSRVRAELAVLAAGGIVLRPLFVYGRGDTRFLPAIIRALTRLPFMIGGGRAQLSVVAAEELANVVVCLATNDSPVAPGAYHVTDGHPVSFRAIADALAENLGLRAPGWSVPNAVGRVLVRAVRGGLLGGPRWAESDDHRLFLVTHDHHYDDAKLRQQLPRAVGPALPDRLPRYTDWYAQFARRGKGSGK